MATVVAEERDDLARVMARISDLRARYALAQPSAAAARELGPRVEPLFADAEMNARRADEDLRTALAETSHARFVAAQEAVSRARKSVTELEHLALAMGAPDTAATR